MGKEVQHPTFLSTTWGSPQPQGFSAGFRRTSQPCFLAQAHLPLSPARLNADLGTTRRETQKVTCWLSVEPQLKSSSCPTPDPSRYYSCATPPTRLRLTLSCPSAIQPKSHSLPQHPPAPHSRSQSNRDPAQSPHHRAAGVSPTTQQRRALDSPSVALGARQTCTSPRAPVAISQELRVGPSTQGSGGSWTTLFPRSQPSGRRGLGVTVTENHCSPWCSARAQVSGSQLSYDSTAPTRWGPSLKTRVLRLS